VIYSDGKVRDDLEQDTVASKTKFERRQQLVYTQYIKDSCICAECDGRTRPGKVDSSDGRWYCTECWEKLEKIDRAQAITADAEAGDGATLRVSRAEDGHGGAHLSKATPKASLRTTAKQSAPLAATGAAAGDEAWTGWLDEGAGDDTWGDAAGDGAFGPAKVKFTGLTQTLGQL
jgi:hypothetical protein